MFYFKMLFIIGLILFVLSLVLLIFKQYRKNIFYYPYEKDNLIATKRDEGYKNYIYTTHGETSKYMNKYVISNSSYDKTLICHFNTPYEKISYYIVEYNVIHKPIRVLEVIERNTANNSKVIILSKNCKDVNVFVKSVNECDVNGLIIKPLNKKRINKYSFVSSLLYMSIVFIADYLIPKLILQEKATTFYLNWVNLTIVGVGVFIFLLHWITTAIKLKQRNLENRAGGVVDYEFY